MCSLFIYHRSACSCPSCSFCDFLSSFTALLAVSLSSVSDSQTWKHPWTVTTPQTVLIAHCSAVATEPSLLFLLQSSLASSKTGSCHLWATVMWCISHYFLALLHIMFWYLCFFSTSYYFLHFNVLCKCFFFFLFFVHFFLLDVMIMYIATFVYSVCVCVCVYMWFQKNNQFC